MAKPLLDKLGWRPGVPALLLDLPAELSAAFAPVAQGTPPGWILACAADRAALARVAADAIQAYTRGGHLWFAYPKKSGALTSDLTRDQG